MNCPDAVPTVHVISDSLGDTACEVVLAASGQFPEGSFRISRLPKVAHVNQVKSYLGPYIDRERKLVVFHTIVNPVLRAQILDYLSLLHIRSIDLIGPAIATLASLTDCEPSGIAGSIHRTDERYFKRIEAMEYFVEHDDGRQSDDLDDAEIVLIGVSRTSKTPLSMYLAYLGYKVANIPLAHGVKPPASLKTVDPTKLIGLLSSVDVISGIRSSRLGSDFARGVAGSYADRLSVYNEMQEAHEYMRRLGCFIVHTEEKSIEESAHEIIDHLHRINSARIQSRNDKL